MAEICPHGILESVDWDAVRDLTDAEILDDDFAVMFQANRNEHICEEPFGAIMKLPDTSPNGSWSTASEPAPGADVVQFTPDTQQIPSSPTMTEISDPDDLWGEPPVPIVPDTGHPAPFPIQALGPLRAAAEAARVKSGGAPIGIAGASALAIASTCVQSIADVEMLHGGFDAVSLFILTIAESGERKSTVDKILAKPLLDHEKRSLAQFLSGLEAFRELEDEHKARTSGIRAAETKGDEDKAHELKAKRAALPPKPGRPTRVVTEPTFEGLAKLLQDSAHRSVGLLSDEGGQFLGGHGMNNDNMQKTVTAVSKIWDGDVIRRTRAGDGSSEIDGARLAIHLQVQPVIAEKLVTDKLAGGQGFLARFLVSGPGSTIGTRLISRERQYTPEADDDLRLWGMRVNRLLNLSYPLNDRDRDGSAPSVLPSVDSDDQDMRMTDEPDTANELAVWDMRRQLHLSDDARAALADFYNETEAAQEAGGELRSHTATASKIAEQACRIAAVLTLFADPMADSVPVQAANSAIMLARFFLAEAVRLTGGAAVPQEDREAEQLRVWLSDRWPTIAVGEGRTPTIVTPRDVTRFGPGSLRLVTKAKAALAKLVTHGWIARLPDGTPVDGKTRKEAYAIRPSSPRED